MRNPRALSPSLHNLEVSSCHHWKPYLLFLHLPSVRSQGCRVWGDDSQPAKRIQVRQRTAQAQGRVGGPGATRARVHVGPIVQKRNVDVCAERRADAAHTVTCGCQQPLKEQEEEKRKEEEEGGGGGGEERKKKRVKNPASL